MTSRDGSHSQPFCAIRFNPSRRWVFSEQLSSPGGVGLAQEQDCPQRSVNALPGGGGHGLGERRVLPGVEYCSSPGHGAGAPMVCNPRQDCRVRAVARGPWQLLPSGRRGGDLVIASRSSPVGGHWGEEGTAVAIRSTTQVEQAAPVWASPSGAVPRYEWFAGTAGAGAVCTARARSLRRIARVARRLAIPGGRLTSGSGAERAGGTARERWEMPFRSPAIVPRAQSFDPRFWQSERP